MAKKLKKNVDETRMDEVREYRARCFSTRDIVDSCTEAWQVGERRVYTYLKRVDDEMAKHGAAMPDRERRFYETTVLRGIHTTVRDSELASLDDKLTPNQRAENRRVALYGYQMLGRAVSMFRDKLEVTGGGGGPLELSITEARARVQGKLEKLAAAR